jgi:hypothetical protein
MGLPTINALVDVLIQGASYPSRVEDVDDASFTVAAPRDVPDVARPVVGTSLDLAWLRAGGRFAVPVRLTGITREQPPRYVVEVVGEPYRHNRRAYMRGGGGESIRLTRQTPDAIAVRGTVVDISEASLRCRVRDADYERDDLLQVSIALGDDVLETTVRVLCVRFDKETAWYDVVATYETTEKVGRIIRRYILQQQMAERRRLMAGA